MARNSFKLPGIKKDPMTLSSSLPSDKPGLIGPEQPATPEARRARFKRLAGILGGFRK